MENNVLLEYERTNDKKVIFYDGILEILCEKGEMTDNTTPEYSLHKFYIDGQYSEPISLYDIAINYPDVKRVIFDSALDGQIFNYRNHTEYDWELVGRTKGYA